MREMISVVPATRTQAARCPRPRRRFARARGPGSLFSGFRGFSYGLPGFFYFLQNPINPHRNIFGWYRCSGPNQLVFAVNGHKGVGLSTPPMFMPNRHPPFGVLELGPNMIIGVLQNSMSIIEPDEVFRSVLWDQIRNRDRHNPTA